MNPWMRGDEPPLSPRPVLVALSDGRYEVARWYEKDHEWRRDDYSTIRADQVLAWMEFPLLPG